MNKKEFLSALASKLSVLNDSEKDDIISEYADTINEKVKNGMTEKDAVKDFGNIDDLAKEVLKAYKINPDYKKQNESIGQKSEEVIKLGAGKIADLSRRLASRFKNANTLALVFEIVIKVFLVLIGLSILGMCFDVFCDIGEGILSNIRSPFDGILKAIWYIFIFTIFVLLGVALVVTVFKKYFEVENENQEAPSKNNKKQLNSKNNEVKTGPTIGDVLLLVVKILVVLWVIIPLIMFAVGAMIGLVFSIVFWIKGLDLLGLVLIMIGVCTLITYIIVFLFKLILSKTKINIIPLIISFILMIIGGIIFAIAIMNISYYDKAPKETVKVTETKTVTIDKETNIHYNNAYNYERDIKKVTDNSMPDGAVKLDITYNKKFYDLNISAEDIKEECGEETCSLDLIHYINIETLENQDVPKNLYKQYKDVFNLFIDNLKHKKIYNYEKMFTGNLKITANAQTLEKITIN